MWSSFDWISVIRCDLDSIQNTEGYSTLWSRWASDFSPKYTVKIISTCEILDSDWSDGVLFIRYRFYSNCSLTGRCVGTQSCKRNKRLGDVLLEENNHLLHENSELLDDVDLPERLFLSFPHFLSSLLAPLLLIIALAELRQTELSCEMD